MQVDSYACGLIMQVGSLCRWSLYKGGLFIKVDSLPFHYQKDNDL